MQSQRDKKKGEVMNIKLIEIGFFGKFVIRN
jgi:hypothetical protein